MTNYGEEYRFIENLKQQKLEEALWYGCGQCRYVRLFHNDTTRYCSQRCAYVDQLRRKKS